MKILISLIVLTAIFGFKTEQKNGKTGNILFVVGTYTKDAKSDGIFVYEFNSNTGTAELKSKIAGEQSPSFLTFNKTGDFMYAVNETRNGNVGSFSFNRQTGELRFLNRVTSGGDSPCFVEVDPNGKYVFVGNYGSGTLSAIPVNADGSLKTDVQTIKHEGTSIDKARQSAPHVHSTFISPDNKYLLVPDLGTDKINIYTIDPGKGAAPLNPANPPFAQVKAGTGPRHLAFLPKSKYIYAVHEMGAMVTAFDYIDGKLTEKQTISMLPQGFTGSVGAADIHLSPDGKFLYASNRGEANDLAIYSVGKNGMLEHIGNQPVGGKMPRNFAIDPTGNYLLVANQTSNDIIIFKRDKKTGKLTQTENKLQVSRPVCIKFVPAK